MLGTTATTVPERPVVEKSAFLTLDRTILSSIRCECPVHADRALLCKPSRRLSAVKTAPLPQGQQILSKHTTEPLCVPEPVQAQKRPKAPPTSGRKLKKKIVEVTYNTNNSPPTDSFVTDNSTTVEMDRHETKNDDHRQHSNSADEYDGMLNPLWTFKALNAQCHQSLTPASNECLSTAQLITSLDQPAVVDDQAEICLVEDSMVVIDYNFLINGEPIDPEEDVVSRGHIINGILAPEFWKPYCVSSIEDLGFRDSFPTSSRNEGATSARSRQAVFHFRSNTISPSATSAIVLSSMPTLTSKFGKNGGGGTGVEVTFPRTTSVFYLVGIRLLFGWVTDTPHLLKQRLAQKYWSSLICPEMLAIHTAMNIFVKDVLKKDYPLVFCAKDIKKVETMLDSVSVLASSMTRIVQNATNSITKHRMQMSIQALQERFGRPRGSSLYQLVATALESIIISSTVSRPQRSLRAPQSSTPCNVTTFSSSLLAQTQNDIDEHEASKVHQTLSPAQTIVPANESIPQAKMVKQKRKREAAHSLAAEDNASVPQEIPIKTKEPLCHRKSFVDSPTTACLQTPRSVSHTSFPQDQFMMTCLYSVSTTTSTLLSHSLSQEEQQQKCQKAEILEDDSKVIPDNDSSLLQERALHRGRTTRSTSSTGYSHTSTGSTAARRRGIGHGGHDRGQRQTARGRSGTRSTGQIRGRKHET